ncbi:MAG: hypothetical protein ACYDAQ_09670 [Mycobacteriales bacterium]
MSTSQWVSDAPVPPLLRVGVTPADFPLRRAIIPFRAGERQAATLLRARRRTRRALVG